MRTHRILGSALVATFLATAFVGTFAGATDELAEQEKLSCTACHDKPGSKLLTDKGKYFETLRTMDGYEEVKATFGECTACHVSKPGSKRLTRQGRQFGEMVESMKGLKAWMDEHHPTGPAPEGDPQP